MPLIPVAVVQAFWHMRRMELYMQTSTFWLFLTAFPSCTMERKALDEHIHGQPVLDFAQAAYNLRAYIMTAFMAEMNTLTKSSNRHSQWLI